MPGRTVTWNRAKLDALVRAYHESKGPNVTATLPGEGTPFTLPRSDAFKLMEQLTAEFVSNPDKPALPNNEGEEGQ